MNMNTSFNHNQKTLWQNYGKYFIILVILSLASYAGSTIYKKRQDQRVEAASLQYDKMLAALRAKEFEKVSDIYQDIHSKYQNTTYATLAGLVQARVDIEQKAMDKAEQHLQDAVNAAKNQKGPLEHVARVRLARLLADQQKYDQALNLLSPHIKTDGYITLYEEAKGDIYVLQNELDKARDAYAIALQAVPQGVTANALQIKLSDLKNKEE